MRAQGAHNPTVAEVGEHALLERLRQRLAGVRPPVALGVGDDAALIGAEGDGFEVLCTDMLVEGVHFDAAWASYGDAGWKAVATTLSDLAAMGAEPTAVLLSVACPSDLPVRDFWALHEAAIEATETSGAQVVGGDLSSTHGSTVLAVTARGHTADPVRRVGARAGDQLIVSGPLGGAAAGLSILQGRWDGPSDASLRQDLVAAQLRPRPEFGAARAARAGAHALVDVSDGLLRSAELLCGQRLGVRVHAPRIPLSPGIEKHNEALSWALSGGEDYRLLAAWPADCPMPDPWVCIGEFLGTPGLEVLDAAGQSLSTAHRGFGHF